LPQSANKYGVAHQKEIEAVPLKVFMKCLKCREGYTGYIVKKKNLWYYKCRTKGCCANKNAVKVNRQFVDFLQKHEIKTEYIPHLIDVTLSSTQSLNDANKDRQNELKTVLNEVQQKIDTIEEKYFVTGEMSKETYEKFLTKFTREKEEILDSFRSCSVTSSNLESFLENVVTFSSKVATGWTSSPVKLKENLQKLIFPSGITYGTKTEAFPTKKVNLLFP
jgi:site-specific DNA recombinase